MYCLSVLWSNEQVSTFLTDFCVAVPAFSIISQRSIHHSATMWAADRSQATLQAGWQVYERLGKGEQSKVMNYVELKEWMLLCWTIKLQTMEGQAPCVIWECCGYGHQRLV